MSTSLWINWFWWGVSYRRLIPWNRHLETCPVRLIRGQILVTQLIPVIPLTRKAIPRILLILRIQ